MKNKKMKKVLFIISAIFILLTGCEIDKVYDGPWFVHLDKETASVVEANATTYLKVVMSGPKKGSQTVDFTISGTAVRGVDYDLNVVGNTLTFPEGTGTQVVEITTIDNTDIEGNRTIEFEISSNSAGYKIGTPGPDGLFKSATITIIDNDCPFVPDDFIGEASSDDDGHTDVFTTTHVSTVGDVVTLSVDKIFQAQMLSWWSCYFTAGGPVEIKLDYSDPANPTATIEPQWMGTDNDGWDYWISQNHVSVGSFSTCDKTITLPYSISWSDSYEDAGLNYTVVISF